ncbi:SurA N-terminal domain-containing protein [Metabacillus litoralis]|uniref:SurA N-terminal domain-containing protein n=1 Tax=Metabacillus TaxID=2675233 RepID=UPI000EF5A356|nr:SurA N-terminal domain-containing protein [Metabacillus litoralis]MCM3160085.1 SurA N-terminal domain-containing protein [Metabacillus litoralis]MCM3408669.1 SurA N-terminal domain-containing protein [Metabacillus litoralis]UHA59670.1 SurA N-terminal domain-containing protein [Metabacillus litoralis]
MKKYLLTVLIGLLSLSLVACNNDEEKASEDTSTSEKATEEAADVDAEEMQKKLEAQKVEEGKVVAIVNGEEIKGNQYNDALSISQMQFSQLGQDLTTDDMAKQIKDYTLESLVGQTLLLQEIDKKGYEASEEDINKQLETLKASYKTEEEFEEALKTNNLTLDKLKEQIADTVKYDQFVKNDLKVEEVKEEEIKEYYDSMVSTAGESEDTPKYEEVKDTLKANLEQQKTQEKVATKVEELRKAADVELKI